MQEDCGDLKIHKMKLKMKAENTLSGELRISCLSLPEYSGRQDTTKTASERRRKPLTTPALNRKPWV